MPKNGLREIVAVGVPAEAGGCSCFDKGVS